MAIVKMSVRAGIVGAAAAVTVSLGAPGLAVADPAPAVPTAPSTETPAPGSSTTPETEAPTLSGIPGDAELAEMLRSFKQSGGSEQAVEALSSILGSPGQLDPAQLLSSLGLDSGPWQGLVPNSPAAPADPTAPTDPAAPSPVSGTAQTPAAGDVLGALQKLTGTQMLSPAIAPFCTTPTDDNPLGIVTAPVVAAPGPWPVAESDVVRDLLTGSGADRLLKLVDPSATERLQEVKEGQTAYALVAPAKTDSDQLRVAWFNTATMQGGIEPLKPLATDPGASRLLKALAGADGFRGVRLARAATGEGTVLSAVFGTTSTGGRTCYFLPALGAVKN